MKRNEFEEKTFKEVIDIMLNEEDYVVTQEDLKDFAKSKIDDDDLMTAIHVLEAIQNDTAEYYLYDYSMGSLETPSSVKCKEDVEHLVEEQED